jgi:FkbM family methyltransferase
VDGSSAWLTRLAVLERGAAVLRRLGLGRVVDAVGARVAQAVDFELEVDGLRLAGNHLGHLYYLRELIDAGREEYLVELLREAARPGSTVLDAGAHLGYLTLQAARAVGPGGRVLAVEPNPNTVDMLRRNVAANPVGADITVRALALGATAGRRSFFVTAAGDTSSLHPQSIASRQVEVEVATADAVLDGGPVHVAKLDLEGGEVEALHGMSDTIRRWRPTIFVECNTEALGAAGTSVDELVAELVSSGYDIRWIDEQARALRPLEEAWPDAYVNLCCTSQEGPAE